MGGMLGQIDWGGLRMGVSQLGYLNQVDFPYDLSVENGSPWRTVGTIEKPYYLY